MNVVVHPLVKDLISLKKQYRDFFGQRERHFFSDEEGQIVMEMNDGGAGNMCENVIDPKVAELIADLLNFIAK